MSLGLALAAIIASVSLGYWLFKTYGTGGADATYDVIALISATFWLLAGLFAILGGFVVLGIAILIIASYIWFSKGKKTKMRLRSRIAG